MRARTVILFLVALILAGGTAMLVRSWLAHQRTVEAEATPLVRPVAPQKSILVARGPISRGQILKPGDFEWQPWADGPVHRAYIQAGTKPIEAFTNSVAREPFGPGDPITEAKIVAPGSRGFAAAALRPGMLAVSVPVTAASDVSGFILPGDQVEVVITHTLPAVGGNAAAQRKAAETVLHDVRVLAVDQKLDSKGEAVVAHTATLEVTPKQSEIIAVASEMGKLSLSLRSLSPSPTEEAAGDSSSSASPGTYTLDSEVSKLLTQKDNGVLILRGNGKSENIGESQPASRGL
jgi:pilus assembly protein CpaB